MKLRDKEPTNPPGTSKMSSSTTTKSLSFRVRDLVRLAKREGVILTRMRANPLITNEGMELCLRGLVAYVVTGEAGHTYDSEWVAGLGRTWRDMENLEHGFEYGKYPVLYSRTNLNPNSKYFKIGQKVAELAGYKD